MKLRRHGVAAFFKGYDVKRVDVLGDVVRVIHDDHVLAHEDEIRMRYGKLPPIAQM